LIPKMNSLMENSFRLNHLKNSLQVHCFRWILVKECNCCSIVLVLVNCCAEEQDLLMDVRAVEYCCCGAPDTFRLGVKHLT